MHAEGVAGSEITCIVQDRRLPGMSASVLEFSLWTARCKQIPDMLIGEEAIEALRPWLRERGAQWRLGWRRNQTKKRVPKVDPRQTKLFEK
jgi:hypothetical protein